ncbi:MULTISPECIES: autoinducer binding domain-containing protein [unclassified Variovorax]|uniref:autoinducer binding domain-containing protein n=1 Tax=unclassified Variovorax TaxID=663243 RepID=UPI003F47F332
MNKWSETLLTALNRTSGEEEVFALVLSSARELGFEYCAYGLRHPLPLTSPKVFMINNYPSEWRELYVQKGYLHIDPTVIHCRKSQTALVWSDDIFESARGFWHSARSFGLNIGWAQSCFDGHGGVGMLTLSRRATPLSQAELDANESHMRWLVNICHQALARVVSPRLNIEQDVPLTSREIEILQWLADGKTSSEAAEILCISADTVNYHLKNAVVKLRAANKTGAVVRAALLGLLS